MNKLTRRHLLGTSAAVAGAVGLGALGGAPAAAAGAPAAAPWTGGTSANGWAVLDRAAPYGIEGSGQTVRLADGGTVIEIRPLACSLGAKGGFFPHEMVVVRDILAELDGTVAWGGDFTTPKECHFEIAPGPGHPRTKGVARKLRGWNDGPGDEGAGAVDAFDSARRKRAQAFARRPAA